MKRIIISNDGVRNGLVEVLFEFKMKQQLLWKKFTFAEATNEKIGV